MKENNQINPKIVSQISNTRRKYSTDHFKHPDSHSSAFFNFTLFSDDQFLNPLHIQPRSINQQSLSSNLFNTVYPQTPHPNIQPASTPYSPTTPNSLSFKYSQYRWGDVEIKIGEWECISYKNAKIFLMGNIFENDKASLIFNEIGQIGQQIEIKISRKEARQIEFTGILEDIQCELWRREEGKYFSIRSTIRLEPLS